MKLKTVISAMFLIVSMHTVAQIENSTTMDRKYIPPSYSIFNNESKAAPIERIRKKFDYGNIIKSEISLLSRGVIAFDYERRLFDPVSMEIGFGPTVFPDYILYTRAIFSDDFSQMVEPSTNGIGYFYKLGFRYNYNDMGDGGFMGIYFRNITHNYYDLYHTGDQYFQASRDVYYDYGLQFPMGERSTGELSFGIGYRFLRYYESRSVGFQYRLYENFDVHFFANIGVKIGFGL